MEWTRDFPRLNSVWAWTCAQLVGFFTNCLKNPSMCGNLHEEAISDPRATPREITDIIPGAEFVWCPPPFPMM